MHRTFIPRLLASGWPQDILSLLACATFIWGSSRLAEIAAFAVAAQP